jgi:hypothetical protein
MQSDRGSSKGESLHTLMFFSGDNGDNGDSSRNYLRKQLLAISELVPVMKNHNGDNGDKPPFCLALSPVVPGGKRPTGDKLQNCNFHEFSRLATLSPLSPLSPLKNIIPVHVAVICDGSKHKNRVGTTGTTGTMRLLFGVEVSLRRIT